MAENAAMDFDEMSFQQKKDLIIKLLLKACNFTDLSATTLNWTSSLPGLFVPVTMVSSLLPSFDFDRMCSKPTGKKSIREMFKTVFQM